MLLPLVLNDDLVAFPPIAGARLSVLGRLDLSTRSSPGDECWDERRPPCPLSFVGEVGLPRDKGVVQFSVEYLFLGGPTTRQGYSTVKNKYSTENSARLGLA